MNYLTYKQRRNAAWDVLLDHKVTTLPVRISTICKQDGIIVRSYRQAADLIEQMGFAQSMTDNDGFAVRIANKDYIFYDDTCTIERQRFTVAHEYGHFVNGDVSSVPTCRNREPSKDDDEIETKANVVAARILAPACVLWALDIHTAEEIKELCNISITAAEFRMERMNLLYKREQEFLQTRGYSCFLLSKKEQQVYEQFLLFITQIKDRDQI